MPNRFVERLRHPHHPKLRIVLIAVVALLVGFRLYLPTLVTKIVNQKLNAIPGYKGHVDGVDIHLWRGAYTVLNPYLQKEDGKVVRPFIEAKDVDLRVNWGALIHFTLVATVEFDALRVNFVAGPSKASSQKGIDLSALKQLRSLVPLRVDKLIVTDGEVHYGNPTGKPPFDIYLDDIQAEVRNITNSDKISKSLVATASVKGRAMKSGHFTVEASIDPYTPKPTFDLQFTLKGLSLKELNAFFADFLAVEMKDGYLAVFAELSVKEGNLKGYVKPLIESLEVIKIKENASVVETLKAVAVQIVSAIFRNRPHEQIGAKIEFKGTLDKPNFSVWDTIVSLLSNAFVQALEPKLDKTVAVNAEQDKNASGADAKKMKESQEKTKKEVNKKVEKSNDQIVKGDKK